MKEITLEVSSRTDTGKGVARKLRAAKKIPAVVYGRERTPQALVLDYGHFHTNYHSLHGENALVNLNIDGKASESKALIRDMQHDPVYGDILHIDFQYIQMDEKIRMSVPVKLIGTAIGVKTFSGVLQWTYRDLNIMALPSKVPQSIDINIEELNIGDAIHIKNLVYQDIEFIDEESETIVSVIAPKIVKVVAAAESEEGVEEAPATEEQAEPEVISEKKAEERKAEKSKKEKE